MGVKALIEHHFWKFEFNMENFALYNTYYNNIHVIMTLNLTDTMVCIFSSVNKYRLQSHANISVTPAFTIGNDIFSFKVNVLYTKKEDDDEDVIYKSYDSKSTDCVPAHKLYFNSVIVNKYDWSVLQVNTDYKLLNLNLDTIKDPIYIVDESPSTFRRLLCSRKSAFDHCSHMAKRMKHITGGYKDILFDITSESSMSCTCDFLKYVNFHHASFEYNYVLLSYKLSQFILNF